MKSIRPLVDKIKQNAIQSIEINNQIACGSEAFPDLDKQYNYTRFAKYIGNNKVLMINNYSSRHEIVYVDLVTKKITTQFLNLPHLNHIKDFVVLDNPNYIALSVTAYPDSSKLLILNTQTMKIEYEEIIRKIESQEGWMGLSLHKYNGQLYGITDHSYAPTYFTAPATFNSSFKLTSKIKMHKDVSGGDMAIDRKGALFFPYQKYCWQTPSMNNTEARAIGNGASVGTQMTLLQQQTGTCYLTYDGHAGNEVHIFKGDDPRYGIIPILHAIKRFPNERVYEVKILSEESKLIIITTEKTSYIYDLDHEMMIGKINKLHSNNAAYVSNAITDGIYFTVNFDPPGGGSDSARVSLINACQMREPNELKTVLDALKTNISVKEVILTDVNLDAASLQSLADLQKMRPDLKLTLSDENQSILDRMKSQESKDLDSSAKIKAMEETQQSQQATITQLRSSVTDLEQKKKKESEQFVKERQALQLKLTEQTAQSSAAMATMEHKLIEQQQAFSAKEQAFLESEAALKEAYETGIIAVQKETQATSERYEELFTQLSVSSLPTQSLAKEINQADQLDQRLCQELIDPKHNIKGLSLIRWSEQDELKHVKEDLEQRGAIFHVDDLVKKIKQIEPPYNDKQTLKSFTKAIERLELDYKNNVLPQSEVNSLISLVLPDIQKDIDIYSWLQELYFPKTEVIKDQLIQQFFSNDAKAETISAVESEFLRAVDNILKNSKYKHHHARLRDNNLLTLIRANENKFDPLVSLIIKTIDITNINLTTEQEALALQAVLEEPTEKLNKLIYAKIIQYLEKMKESVDPKLVTIQQLENKVKALEQKEGVTHVAATMFNGRQEHNKPIAHPLPLRRSQSWS